MSEFEETTNQLRFVERETDLGQMKTTRRVLQQAHRIMVRDDETCVLMGGRIEWRDVPLVDEFASA
jgi:hypothetical protein